MHVGFELSAVLGANRKLGDNWRMLKWQLNGKMGGARGKARASNGNGHGNGNGHSGGNHGTHGEKILAPPPGQELVSKEGNLRVL